jgi:hypothetical protein
MAQLNNPKKEETKTENKLRNDKHSNAKGSTIRVLTAEESEVAVGGCGGQHPGGPPPSSEE